MKKTTTHNKLVRDKIPQILLEKGVAVVTHIADEREYAERLIAKLNEEVAEFEKDRNEEELADLLEVIHAAALHYGFSMEQIEELRAKKAEERGGFEGRVVLEETIAEA